MKRSTICCFILVFLAATLVLGHADAQEALCAKLGVGNVEKCSADPRLKALGCEELKPLPEAWAKGLKYDSPMALCERRMAFGGQGEDRGLDRVGCKLPIFRNIITFAEDGRSLTLIDSKDKFARTFLPIDDTEEAISFAAVITQSMPTYIFPPKGKAGKWLVRNPEPTHAEKKDDGWHVILYYQPFCGCHNFELFQRDYLIKEDGSVSQLSEKKVWRSDTEICVD